MSLLRSWAAPSALAALASLAVGERALAQAPVSVGQPIATPGRNVASVDDATATAENPANLAFLPAPEVRWQYVHTGDSSPWAGRGHAIDAAAPLWIFGSGLRVELHNPPDAAAAPFVAPYQWVRWGLSGRVNDWLGLGAQFAWSLSDSPRLDGQFAFGLGATARPTEWSAVSAVLRDVNSPVSNDGLTRTARAWELGAAFRPISGRRDLEIGVQGRVFDQLENGTAELTLGVDVPYVGRVRGEVGMTNFDPDDPQVLAMLGVDVNFGMGQVSGGAIFGNGVGLETPGFYAGAAFRFYREPGIPIGKRVARLDINATPGNRGHVALLRRLWRIAENDEIEGLVLVMKDEPASSMAHAEEVADAIRLVRAKGKKVACHLEDAGGKSLFVCSAADRIGMNPAGGLRFAGLSSRYFYFGGALESIGVQADFVRIGKNKSAAEQFTLPGPTDTTRENGQDLVDQYEKVFLAEVARGRRSTPEKLEKVIAGGPFIATEARTASLVDSLVYPDEIGRFVNEVMGEPVNIVKTLPFSEAPTRWTKDDKIAIVYLAGDMVDGESQNIPLVNIRLAGSRTITSALKQAKDDPSIKAVVFRIETGGGSSLAADVIHREVELLAKKKPVVISMGSAAASGGYYVAVGGGKIFANRTTVTGSIGIFYGKVDVSGLLAKLGVGTAAYTSAPRADAESFFRPFTEDERQELGRKVKQFYDLFAARVAEGRKLPIDEVDAVARGRVWTGAQAKDRKLVDELGGFRQAVEEARRLADLPDDAGFVELPVEDDSLLGFLLKLVGLSSANPMVGFVPPALLDVARALAPFMVFDPAQPMARAELFEVGSYPRGLFDAADEDAAIDPVEDE
jgi:protease-4